MSIADITLPRPLVAANRYIIVITWEYGTTILNNAGELVRPINSMPPLSVHSSQGDVYAVWYHYITSDYGIRVFDLTNGYVSPKLYIVS